MGERAEGQCLQRGKYHYEVWIALASSKFDRGKLAAFWALLWQNLIREASDSVQPHFGPILIRKVAEQSPGRFQ